MTQRISNCPEVEREVLRLLKLKVTMHRLRGNQDRVAYNFWAFKRPRARRACLTEAFTIRTHLYATYLSVHTNVSGSFSM